MPISQKLKALIKSAWDDGAPCLVATQGPNGPNISPKGSMVIFDDEHPPIGSAPRNKHWKTLGTKSACALCMPTSRRSVKAFWIWGSCDLTVKPNCMRPDPLMTPSSRCCCRVSKRMSARIRHRRAVQDRACRRCTGKAAALMTPALPTTVSETSPAGNQFTAFRQTGRKQDRRSSVAVSIPRFVP